MSRLSDGVKDNHYVSGPQFYQLLCEYYKASEDVQAFEGEQDSKEYRHLLRIEKKCLDKCGFPLYKMIVGLSNNPKFSGYTWKDEMIADALVKCTKALEGKKYKIETKYNPFSYFNRIAWREFLRRIKEEKKMVSTRNEYIEEHRKDFAEEDDSPIYVKPSINSQLANLYDVENEVTYNDISDT